MKNFSAAWISGSANHKLSNVSNHGRSDQHKLSMSLLRADEAKAMKKPITTYAPIAKSILVMDRSLEEKRGKKFDICYVLAKENMAFLKYIYSNPRARDTPWGRAMPQKTLPRRSLTS